MFVKNQSQLILFMEYTKKNKIQNHIFWYTRTNYFESNWVPLQMFLTKGQYCQTKTQLKYQKKSTEFCSF